MRSLTREVLERVNKRIKKLEDNPRPHGAKMLQGEDSLYRIRIGDYRIVYQIEDDIITVTVVLVGPRGDVYRLLHICLPLGVANAITI